MTTYTYKTELTSCCPRAEQPPNIKTVLKAHQLAGLYKAIKMEQDGFINYDMHGENTIYEGSSITTHFDALVKMKSNMGILGDIVGYGKTLTALSIIASSNINTIHKNIETNVSYCNSANSGYISHVTKNKNIIENNIISSTLIIVPRGPVFVQWEKTLRDRTSLKYIAIDNVLYIKKNLPSPTTSVKELIEFFNQYDVVLVKNTTFETLKTYYQDIVVNDNMKIMPILKRWKRIMIDEAHELNHSISIMYYDYLWLITSTYNNLLYSVRSPRSILYNIRDGINYDTIDLLLVKGNRDFVRNSFKILPPIEQYYLCKMPSHMYAIKNFVCSNILDKINANDIEGAIKDLGGKIDTQSNVLDLVSNDLRREITNKEREKEYINSLDIPRENKKTRIKSIENDIKMKHEKLADLTARITEINTKMCSICMYDIEHPIMLECTHSYCASCITQWINKSLKCPECRTHIETDKMVSIMNEHRESPKKCESMSKIDTLIKIIKKNPSGRYIVFSQYDNGFTEIKETLQKYDIVSSEMKGNTSHMMNVLNDFQNGKIRVILLNTNFAGSGIDISFATDVILYHSMGTSKQQAIGRAQRVGRNDVLNIHYLCYEHEMPKN
jgi:superfamily II DNA or RNA helicase